MKRRTFLASAAALAFVPGRAEDVIGPATRLLFLGDSITYAGGWVEEVECFLRTRWPERRWDIVNAGLPSETVSGLSEAGHAGGAFPRPDLHERLDRVLALVKPELVFACYGMNDGIYLPFADERFAAYRSGIERLREKVGKAGAKIVHLTPAVFDPVPLGDRVVGDAAAVKDGQMFAGYDGVLARYAQWLLEKRTAGWSVIDVHGPVRAELDARRAKDAAFRFAGDGVHPNDEGHAVMARAVMHALDAEQAAAFAKQDVSALRKLVHQRQSVLKDAVLTTAGHKRPGMAKGLPLDEAKAKSAALEPEFERLARATR